MLENTRKKLISQFPHISYPIQAYAHNYKAETLAYKSIGARTLYLDFYRAKSKHKTPLLVLIHGGGWKSGSKALLAPMAKAIAHADISVACIEYRLSGEAQFPAGFSDARDAVLWLKSAANKLNIDPNNVAIAGGSAGGQLAALLAYSGGKLNNQNIERPFVIQALINIDGLSDFTSEEALPFENDPKKNPSSAGAWLGGRYEEVPERWKQASPYFHIDSKAPPTLFINSSQTRFRAGRDAAIAALKKHGIPTEIVLLEKSPHAFWHFEPWFSPTIESTITFLSAHLKTIE